MTTDSDTPEPGPGDPAAGGDGVAALVPDVLRATYLRKFAVLTLATLVVVAGAGVVLQGEVAAELRGQKHAELQTNAELEANEISVWLRSQRQATRLLADATAPHVGDDLEPYLAGELAALPESTDAIHYVDATSGEVYESTTPDRVGTTYSHAALVFNTDDDVVMGVPYERGGDQLIGFASLVPGTERAVVVTVDAATVAEGFHSSVEGGETQVVEVDSGTVVLSSVADQVFTQYDGNRTMVAGWETETGSHETNASVLGYAPVEGTDWVVLESAPRANAYALVQTVRTEFLILVALSLGGFVLLGGTVGRSTGRTLRSLAGQADALARGELTDEAVRGDGAAVARIDEVGRMQRSFAAVSTYVRDAADQADAVADREFDAPALEREVPGRLGESLGTMATDLESLLEELAATNEALQQAAESYGDGMDRAAAGDLTVRLDDDVDNEAMARIARRFNEMLAEIAGTVARVESVAGSVARASEQADRGVSEAERAADEVAESVAEISAGAAQQSTHVDRVTGEMGDLSAAVEEVASTADDVAARSAEAADRGERGTDLASAAAAEMDAIESTTERTADAVRDLDDDVDEIGEIVDLIDGIAEQTNTLALNASIEAARAGAEGNGFAVVAEEVKALAAETREATTRIAALVDDVQSSTTGAVADIERTSDRVADGADTIERGLAALEDVVEAVEESNDGVQAIATAADDQAESAEEVVAMTDEVATVSEETAAEAQSVAAAADQQASSLNEVAGELDRLSSRAAELDRLTDEFETDGAGADGTAGVGADAGVDAEPGAVDDAARPAETDGGESR
ncbi:methyl-accepting chemotaxis protein [Halobaculum lipolyticum]|uniref:Methyl-accepting chemotaxis protein n=1 Tax=Halobaculum lipolyticum TaxID=3032001 RepID=A0ABD5WFT6_9EURY|nr:methyl-accepting chemotaxis protein [Halobaculum sp. DT31]